MTTITSPPDTTTTDPDSMATDGNNSDGGENVLFALPEQPKSKPLIRHRSNLSNVSGDSGYHGDSQSGQRYQSQTSSEYTSDSDVKMSSDSDVKMASDDVQEGVLINMAADSSKMDIGKRSQQKSGSKDAQDLPHSPDMVDRTQSPDSAMSDDQSSPKKDGESRPDRSGMKLDFQSSPVKRDASMSKSPSEPLLKNLSRSSVTSPRYVNSHTEIFHVKWFINVRP